MAYNEAHFQNVAIRSIGLDNLEIWLADSAI